MKNSFHFGSCSNCKQKTGHMNRVSGSGVSFQLCDRCLPGNRFYVERSHGFWSLFRSVWNDLKEIAQGIADKFNRRYRDEKSTKDSKPVKELVYSKKSRYMPQNKAAQNPQLMR